MNGSCEQIALIVQAVLDGNPHDRRWIVMQVDIRNAFSTVHRKEVLEAVSARGNICSRENRHPSSRRSFFWGMASFGGHQGEPMSPLFFSLAIHAILVSCQRTYWYLDDGTVVGDLASIRDCLSHLRLFCGRRQRHRFRGRENTLVGPWSARSTLTGYLARGRPIAGNHRHPLHTPLWHRGTGSAPSSSRITQLHQRLRGGCNRE